MALLFRNQMNNLKRFSSVVGQEYVDIIRGINLEKKIGSNGFIRLVDSMPRLVPQGCTGDMAIVRAARISYGDGENRGMQDESLIRFLMRHSHTSPFEMAEVTFHVKAPIFVVRQWIRHRTANVNEWSGRYTIMPNEFYRPETIHQQSASNKQCSGDQVNFTISSDFMNYLDQSEKIRLEYEKMILQGVSREQARIALPISVYTQFYWKCDLHNIFNFLRLRMADDSQYEIRMYARAMHDLIRPLFPVSFRAFDDYQLNSMKLSGIEVDAIKTGSVLSTKNRREIKEFKEKLEKLNLQSIES